MSKKQNQKSDPTLDENIVEEESLEKTTMLKTTMLDEETQEEPLEDEVTNTQEEDVVEVDEKLLKDLSLLDEGELSLFNEDKMEKLLTHIMSLPKNKGKFNPSKNVKLIDSMIHDIKNVSEIPDNAIVSISYTKEELDDFSRDLMRIIQVNQYKRVGLSREEIDDSYVRIDDLKLILTNEEARLLGYITAALSMLDKSPTKDSLKKDEWTNVLEYNDKRIGTALVVTHKDPVKQIKSKLNLMNEAAVDLIHSGLVIKLASAGALDQALLNDNLVSAKINNSLATFGSGLDMTSIYIDEILVDHIHRQIIESNVGDMSRETFEEHLSILDLNVLYNAMAISLHPTGYKLYRQCMDIECATIDEITINPRRVVLYRDDKITQAAKQHMVRKFAKSDISVLSEYRSNLNPDVSKYHEISEDVYIKFRIPSFAEYKRISKHWMEYLGDKSMELMRSSMDEEARRRYIQQAMSKASVMMYSHWVEGVYTKDENGDYQENMVRLKPGRGVTSSAITDSDEKVDSFISDLSFNRDIHNGLVKAIDTFIRDSNLSVTAIAKSKCSKCGGKYESEGEEIDAELISFNASELFFTLLHRKTGEL